MDMKWNGMDMNKKFNFGYARLATALYCLSSYRADTDVALKREELVSNFVLGK